MKQGGIKKILVPMDFSETSVKALDYAEALAKNTGADILLLHVIENVYATTDPFYAAVPREPVYENDLRKISNEGLEKAAEAIGSNGEFKIKKLSATGRTHKEIIKVSEEENADIIVMGTHGVSGFREFVMGSNTYRVVSDSKRPVLSIQSKGKDYNFKKILVPFTDRPHSREKVMYAIKMAKIYGSTLYVLGINDGGTKAHAKKIALEAAQIENISEDHGVKCKVSVVSAPRSVKTILQHAKKIKADLIVSTGDSSKQDITEYFSGSLSQQIVNHSPVPVLSVHAKFNPKTVALWQGI